MTRNNLLLRTLLVATAICAATFHDCFAQESGAPPSSSSGTSAAPVGPPDLTPPGYLPKDPLYNDSEVKLGRAAADEIAKAAKFSQDKALVARVQAIGAKIAAVADVTQVKAGFGNDTVMPYHYTYHVIDSKEVNAFSLPGGFIYIYKGMLDLITSDDELAGVLGHETSHAAHHHVSTLDHEANKMSNAMLLAVVAALVGHVNPGDIASIYGGASYGMQGVLNNTFSEHAEEDADHTGMIFMQKAGYNPVGMLTMLERLENQEKMSPDVDLGFLQDHPLTPDRVAAAKAELTSLGVTLDPETIRQADDSLPVLVSPETKPAGKTVTISVSGNPVVTLTDANRPEAVAAAKELDELLNRNLMDYEVKAEGSSLIAHNQTLLTITDADAAVQTPPSTPEAVALDARHKLALVIYAQETLGVPDY
jgi:predicted Zn-dependent protease